jgi:hypothetical protein
MFTNAPIGLLLQQVVAVGVSKLQISPHSTDLVGGHCTCRQLVGQQPTTVTVWLQLVLLPQPSVINHVCVMAICGQAPLVTVPVGIMLTLAVLPVELLVQQDDAVGVSKLQATPQSTVLFGGHCTCKQLVPALEQQM